MAFNNEQVNEILDLLREEYPDAGCALDHKDVFQLIVAVALSAQTTDKSVNKVTPALFEKYPTPQALAAANQRDVENILRVIGMYKTKAKNIIAMSDMIVKEYDGQVPHDFNEMVKLPGVGRKTANVVLAEGFGEQHIAVDTHVFRVSNRIGLVKETDVLKTEKSLMKVLPEDRWTEAHHELIFHGRNSCNARKPDCDGCVLTHLCKRVGVNK